jgi:hypothetical protein
MSAHHGTPTADQICALESDAALLSARLDHYQSLVDERFAASGKALEAAQVAADRRFETMNEFRSTFGDMVTGQRAKLEGFTAEVAKTEADVQALRERVETIGRPNPLVLVSLSSVVFALIASAWFVIGLQIDNRIAPINVFAEQSRTDRNQLNERLRAVETTLASRNTANERENAEQTIEITKLKDRLDTLTAGKR